MTDLESVKELFKVAKGFISKCGLNLNENNTLLILVPWRSRSSNPLYLEQAETVSTLGISVGRDLKQQNLKYYLQNVEYMKNHAEQGNQEI